MLKNLGIAGLMPARRGNSRFRPASRLAVEALEGRLLLSGDMVLRWNDALVAALRTAGQSPTPTSRFAAIVQAAVYDAVNSIDRSFMPYLAAIPAPDGADESAAAAQAAHDALVNLFPTQATALDLELKASLQTIPDGDAKTAGILVGQAAAQNILAARAKDGSDKVVDYTPGTNPGDWQPTPPAYGPPLQPQWPQVTPFCLQSASQFRPPPPPALTSPEYTAAFNQVKDLGSVNSTTRTADETEAAMFWQGIAPPTITAYGLWDKIAQEVAVSQGNTLVQNARMLALLNLTMADEAIAGWDAKYTYNFWRPVTAIRAADTVGNPDTQADPTWLPLFATPSHPSYPSAHAFVSTGAAAELTAFFGTDAIPFNISWEGLPGVTLTFTGFTAAGDEASMSRLWAGIHWSFDIAAGQALGRSVADYVFQNYLLPRTSPPPGAGSAGTQAAMNDFAAAEQLGALPGASLGQGLLSTDPLSGATLALGGSSHGMEATGAGLPPGQALLSSSPGDAVSNSVVSQIYGTEISRARSENARPPSYGRNVDAVFRSTDPWEGPVDWAG